MTTSRRPLRARLPFSLEGLVRDFACLSVRAYDRMAVEPKSRRRFPLPVLMGAVCLLVLFMSATAAAAEGEAEGGFSAADLIEPLGALTLTLILATIGAALLRKENPRLILRIHKILAVATLLSAISHLVLVFVAG